MRTIMLVALAWLLSIHPYSLEAAADWPEYAAALDGSGMRPVYQRLAFSEEVPEDLEVEDTLRQTSLLFAQWRYGSPSSSRVAMMIRPRPEQPDVFDLYVDQDRDRRISVAELVSGQGNTRDMVLKAEWTTAEGSELRDRTVRARYAGGDFIEVATIGYLTQVTSLGGRQLSVRIVDGDANGLWADPEDRIWIDFDDDGKWSPFREQFPVQAFLYFNDVRYALNISPLETRPLRLIENSTTGTVRAILPFLDKSGTTQLEMMEVMLVGDDGFATVINTREDYELPTGFYHIASLMFSLRSPGDIHPLNFVFAGAGAKGTRRFEVAPDEATEIDIVGNLRFELEVRTQSGSRAAERTLAVDPRLYTQDGLLITSCWRGVPDRAAANDYSNPATISVLCRGTTVATATSGFA